MQGPSVVRLGLSNVAVVNSQRYRIKQGQILSLQYISNVIATIRAWARVRYDNGEDDLLFIADESLSTDPVGVTLTRPSDVARMDGWVTDAAVELPLDTGVRRGQVYVRLYMEPFGAVLCSDYVYSNPMGQVALGTYIQSGPGGGGGHLRVETIKAIGAPAASTTYTLRVANTVRKIMGVSWYYESSVDVATRVLSLFMQGYLGIGPATQQTLSEYIWIPLILTLTASQDGMIFADEKRSGTNDNSAVVITDAAAAPTPFPLWVMEDWDAAVRFNFTVGAGEVLDEDAIYALVEEWVVL